jgi:hypothetical protein
MRLDVIPPAFEQLRRKKRRRKPVPYDRRIETHTHMCRNQCRQTLDLFLIHFRQY